MPEKTPLVMVVNDNPQELRLLETQLKAEGYRVACAANGSEALRMTEKALPDLFLLDVLMPEMDGIELTRRLKSDPRTRAIPIIMLTVLRERESRLAALEQGAEDFLSQPVDALELGTRVRNLLRLKAHQDLLADRKRLLEEQVAERTQELAEREELLRRLTSAARDAIVMVDRLDRVTFWNESAEKMFGYSAAEATGRALRELIVPGETGRPSESPEPGETEAKSVLGDGDRALELSRKDGTTLFAECSFARVNLRGEWHGVAIVRDVTERNRAEEALCRQLDELRRFQRATVDRELRMRELREENRRLKERLTTGGGKGA